LALLARKEETLIAAVNLFVTPLSFLSSSFMQRDLTPHWIQIAAGYNPVTWAVEAARDALSAQPHWDFVLLRMGWLLLTVLVCGAFATRAFRVYQRSV
jgi:ABC-2 type transport system permease protein